MIKWSDGTGFTEIEEARWMTGGPGYFDFIAKLIEQAKESISLFVYILTPDTTGNRIIGLLKEAALRGVVVQLLVDDFGSDALDHHTEADLTASGVKLKRFAPFFSGTNFYIGRRMHAKVLVTDHIHAVVGGINIAARYEGDSDGPAWLDYAVYIRGSVSTAIEKNGLRLKNPMREVKMPALIQMRTKKAVNYTGKTLARFRVNDFLKNRREITKSYNQAVKNARHSVTIVGGYFIPGRRFRRYMRLAVKRGVKVKVLLTHFSDVPVTRLASEYLYGWMIRNGIGLYEYKTSMVHGKAAVVDSLWVTIGSYNQNHLSAYLSIELNVDLLDAELAESLEKQLEGIIATESNQITFENYTVKAWWMTKLKRWVSYHIVQTSLRLLFVANRIFRIDD
ncbi:MAG TPA: phospholipase D-like domain-containing protein [Bacteroidia bacterium]|nr:phospholipase D-like domain-containing protein [Bacteroidia bacterium]